MSQPRSHNESRRSITPADRNDWIARLTGRVTIADGGCWIVDDSDEYVSTHVTRRGYERIHRLVYQTLVAPIPPGWHVHHRCRSRACINPAHLEAMSASDHGRLHAHSGG